MEIEKDSRERKEARGKEKKRTSCTETIFRL